MRLAGWLTAGACLFACGGKAADTPAGAGGSGGACEQHDADGNIAITCPVIWTGDHDVAGRLRIQTGGQLTLDHAKVHFGGRVEDAGGVEMHGDGRLIGTGCLLDSSSGRQWNLEAYDAATLQLDSCVATAHAGIRANDKTLLTANGGNLEELQLHDDASITLDGTAAYLVLFFGQGADAHFDNGELGVGKVTRTFAIANGTGHASLALHGADVGGWQIDLLKNAKVSVGMAPSLVLAVHLEDATFLQGGQKITSDSPQDGQFSFGPGSPQLSFTSSVIGGLNFYLEGSSNLTFDGAVHVIEPDAGGSSKVVFGAAAQIEANIAQTYDTAVMELDGSSLVDDGTQGLFPSFSATDSSTIVLKNVSATAHAHVQSVGAGKVIIDGGNGWTADKIEEIDKQPGGGVTLMNMP